MSRNVKKDELPYVYMHAIGHILYTPYSPLARAVVRDAIDLSPRVALTSWIFSYSFQPAACPDATSSTDTAIDPTNACEYIYVASPNTCTCALMVCTLLRVCVHCAAPYNRQLNSWAPTRCIHSSVCTAATYACTRDNNYAHTYRKLSFGAVSKRYTPASSSWIHVTISVTLSYTKYSGIVSFSLARCSNSNWNKYRWWFIFNDSSWFSFNMLSICSIFYIAKVWERRIKLQEYERILEFCFANNLKSTILINNSICVPCNANLKTRTRRAPLRVLLRRVHSRRHYKCI